MTDRLSDEVLDHLIETHRGTLADAAKKKQVYAPVKNLEQTIKGLEEAKEKRAEARQEVCWVRMRYVGPAYTGDV